MIKYTPRAPRALTLIGYSSIVALALSLSGQLSAASNGVNLQPSYYNNGLPNMGWSLMNSYSKIKTVRIEVEPGKETQAKTWIAGAKSNSKTMIVTYHKSSVLGSDSTSELSAGGTWWKNYYSSLSSAGSFQINLMNEWGSGSITSNAYASAYNTAISLVRKAYSGNIILDLPAYGSRTQTGVYAVLGTNGTKISDTNITLSTHIYPNTWNADTGKYLALSDIYYMSNSGRNCMVGEFGAGSGSTPWGTIVTACKNGGWTVLGWAWNGDGNALNMVSPSWASNPTATSFSISSYGNTIYGYL